MENQNSPINETPVNNFPIDPMPMDAMPMGNMPAKKKSDFIAKNKLLIGIGAGALVLLIIVGILLIALSGGKVKYYKKKEMVEILKEDFGLKKNRDFDVNSYDDYDKITAEFSSVNFTYYLYDDIEEAEYYITDNYDEDEFGGTTVYVDDGDIEYITINGLKLSSYNHYYGGVYRNGDMIIKVLTTSTSAKKMAKVNEILDTLGLPLPEHN